MKRTLTRALLSAACLFASLGFLRAQNQIAVQSDGGFRYFAADRFADALNAANTGDTLYLPSGLIAVTADARMTKAIHLVGAGYAPADETELEPTILSGETFYVTTGADAPSDAPATITGIYFEGDLQIGTEPANSGFRNLTVARCSFRSLYAGPCADGNCIGTANEAAFRENVVRGDLVGAQGVRRFTFERNILEGRIRAFGNATLKCENNLFLNPAEVEPLLNGVTSAQFRDNVILSENVYDETSGSLAFLNNVFSGELPRRDGIVAFRNMEQAGGADALFESVEGFTGKFDPAHDYHLKQSGPAAETDAGLFGGNTPYKTSRGTFAPQVKDYEVDGYVNESGKLRVKFNVEAQKK